MSDRSERFSEPVEAVLREAGWHPGRRISDDSLAEMHRGFRAGRGRLGAHLDDSSFADPVLAEFGGLVIAGPPPGVALSPRPFAIDPALAAHSVEALIDTGRAINSGVYPLGVEGLDEAVLAITDQGRVLAIDPVDDWFLGDTIDEALDLLITGRQPRPVIAEDVRTPRWLPPPVPASDPAIPGSRLRQPVGAAFYLPRTALNLYYTWLSPTLTRMGIHLTVDPHRPGEFQVDNWGGVRCEVHVQDLPGHTALVLAFEADAVGDQLLARPMLPEGFEDMPEELKRMLRELGPAPSELSPLARAFRNACSGLAPDLRAACLRLDPRDNLLRLVAEQDDKLRRADGAALLDGNFAMLYVAEGADDGLTAPLAGTPRERLPIESGHLVLGGRDS